MCHRQRDRRMRGAEEARGGSGCCCCCICNFADKLAISGGGFVSKGEGGPGSEGRRADGGAKEREILEDNEGRSRATEETSGGNPGTGSSALASRFASSCRTDRRRGCHHEDPADSLIQSIDVSLHLPPEMRQSLCPRVDRRDSESEEAVSLLRDGRQQQHPLSTGKNNHHQQQRKSRAA